MVERDAAITRFIVGSEQGYILEVICNLRRKTYWLQHGSWTSLPKTFNSVAFIEEWVIRNKDQILKGLGNAAN